MKNLTIKKHSREPSLSNTKSLLYITNKILNTSLIPSTMRYRIHIPTGYSYVEYIAITEDGKYIISGGDDCILKVWDFKRRKEIETYEGDIFALQFMTIVNKKYIFSISGNTAKLWDIQRKKEVWITKNTEISSLGIALSPDGKYFISNNGSNILILWDLRSGKKLRSLLEIKTGEELLEEKLGTEIIMDELDKGILLEELVYERDNQNSRYYRRPVSTTITEDSNYVVSGCADGIIRVYNIEYGEEVKTFEKHNHSVCFVILTKDGKYMFSISNHTSMKLWDFISGEEIWSVPISTSIESAAITADGKYIILGEFDNKLRLLDAKNGNEIWSTSVDCASSKIVKSVESITITADGKYVISGSHDYSMRLWDIKTGKCIDTFGQKKNKKIYTIFASNEAYIVSADEYGVLKLFNLMDGEIVWSFKGHDEAIESIAISQKGKYIVSGDADGKVKLWDLSKGALMKTFKGHDSGVGAIALSFDDSYIVSSSEACGKIKLWDLQSIEEVWCIENIWTSIHTLIISSDNKYVISGCEDSSMYLWSVSNGSFVQKYHKYREEYAENLTAIVIAEDGKYIVTAESYAPFQIWNLDNGEAVRTFKEHPGSGVDLLAITKNSKYIVSGEGRGGCLTLWDFHSGEKIWTIIECYSMFAIINDDKYIVTKSEEDVFKFWDLLSGKELIKFVFFEDDEWIHVAPDGCYNCSDGAAKHFSFYDKNLEIPQNHPIYKERKKDILLENY